MIIAVIRRACNLARKASIDRMAPEI